MPSPSESPTRLADYKPPAFLVDDVRLVFKLHPRRTTVHCEASFRPNPEGPQDAPLALNGQELRLLKASVDGRPLGGFRHQKTADTLYIDRPSLPTGPFTWECVTQISPETNTSLEGLYMSKGMYCTQCEAEGFRKITYYPDRPDVMARFRVRIEGAAATLLSNGNPVESGEGFAEWDDPWPKPSYLFALVAGDLVSFDSSFKTASGRDVDLRIWVRPGDETRCDFAMDALKRAMRWDERTYGREYDLDLFQIVAVDDFNMGAMENKGLNIFNSAYVLSSPETATDRDYENIERIIAHEYFHNWTGNRITCRDWFQLSLKEGLTVFRDQQFCGDMRSRAVKRIEDATRIQRVQFREDAGPLAHPVRPPEYIEINNFYTSTVYEKGAEVIGMLKRIVGDEAYYKALDLYFERHDGQACSIEDWLKAFEDSCGCDTSQFKLWYEQAGTPRLSHSEEWDGSKYTLTLTQETPPTPGQPDKRPMVIPVEVGLLGQDGKEAAPSQTFLLAERTQSFSVEGLSGRPTLSLLRGFSAPVTLKSEPDDGTLAFLLAHDTDPYSKWQASSLYARRLLARMSTEGGEPDPEFIEAIMRSCGDEGLDPALRAHVLALPAEEEIARHIHESGAAPDPDRIHASRKKLRLAMATGFGEAARRIFELMEVRGPYSPDPEAAGKRSLRLAMLGLISLVDGGAEAEAQFGRADNMTESMGSLGCLMETGREAQALEAFHQRWSHDPIVLDKWLLLQVSRASPERAVETASRLAGSEGFDWRNPNRFRAVVAGFAFSNHAGFHRADGSGYRFLAGWLKRVDPLNPQLAARVCGAFETWRRYDSGRQGLARAALEDLSRLPELSRDMGEMVQRTLGG